MIDIADIEDDQRN